MMFSMRCARACMQREWWLLLSLAGAACVLLPGLLLMLWPEEAANEEARYAASGGSSRALFGIEGVVVITVPERRGLVRASDLAAAFGAPVRVLKAVTPANLTRADLSLRDLYEIAYGRTAGYASTDLGQVACFRSHLAALRLVPAGGALLVAEDDVVTGAGLRALRPALVSLDLFIRRHRVAFDVLRLTEMGDEAEELEVVPGLALQRCAGACMPMGTTAYVATHAGAAKLLGLAAQGAGLQIDYFMDVARLFRPDFDMWGVRGLGRGRLQAEGAVKTQVDHAPCVRCEVPTDVALHEGRASFAGAWWRFARAMYEHAVSRSHRRAGAEAVRAQLLALP